MYEFATPMNGFSKSLSSLICPVALSKLLCGAYSKPFLTKSDLIYKTSYLFYFEKNKRRGIKKILLL